MAQMLDLPFELLNVIMIMLATSYDGARDVARVSTTCKLFMALARQSNVLKVVNFERLMSIDDYRAHHHRNDLLCQCAQVRNLAAETLLGKALLNNDIWFWDMILENHQPPPVENGSSGAPLRHQQLVRSFICHGACEDIAPMRIPLFGYMISFVGYDRARDRGILQAITKMCSFEITRLEMHSLLSEFPNIESRSPLLALNLLLAKMAPPPGLSHRDSVLAIFDELFPSSPM